jgi:hypothetical protein
MTMTQTTVSTNGHANGQSPGARDGIVRDGAAPAHERRQTAASATVTPEALVERHVENARRQLADARERLKGARRRVVQLEDALGNWERFAAEVRRAAEKRTPPG